MRPRRRPLARRVRPRPVPAPDPTIGYGVEVYAVGGCHASVCYPRSLQLTYVTDALDSEHPTGLDHGWQPSEDPAFSGGQPNPCRCDRDPSRVHRLFVC